MRYDSKNLEALVSVLAYLRAIKWLAWTAHWKAKGTMSYSDHLLFQRVYAGDGGGPDIDEEIDGLGERLTGLYGQDAVNPAAVAAQTSAVVQHALEEGHGDILKSLALTEWTLSAAILAAVRSLHPDEVIMDNFLRGLVDARSTVAYLLNQRVTVRENRGRRR